MSNGMNKVTLFGNLGSTPELRRTPAGKAMLKATLATNRSWVTKDGVRGEDTQWHNIVVFGKRAEGLARVLRKGSYLLVEGRIEHHTYEKEGTRRYFTQIVAEQVVLGGRGARVPEGEAPAEADMEAHDSADSWADAHDRTLTAERAAPAETTESTEPPASPADDAPVSSGPSPRNAPEVVEPEPAGPKPPRGDGHGDAAEVPVPPPRRRHRAPTALPLMAA